MLHLLDLLIRVQNDITDAIMHSKAVQDSSTAKQRKTTK